MTKYLKPWGGHHIPLGLLIALVLGPLANAVFWVGKELGEAIERAGGTGKALKDWSQKKNGGPWEPWDFITPAIMGYALDALLKIL